MGFGNRNGKSRGRNNRRNGPPRGDRFRDKPNRGGRGGFDKKRKNSRPFNRPRKNAVENWEKATLNEVDAGITEYVSQCEGFTGILKLRYSDFHVNEIDMDGNITKLTNLKVPAEPRPGNLVVF